MEDKEVLRIYRKVFEYIDKFNIYEVRNIARAFGVNAPTTAKKRDLILSAIRVGAGIADPGPRSNKGARVKASDAPAECIAAIRALMADCNRELTYVGAQQKPVELRFRDMEPKGAMYGYDDPCMTGVLEISRQGHGFLRGSNFTAREGDTVVSDKLIEKYRLREGDIVSCYVVEDRGKTEAVQVAAVNGAAPVYIERKKFAEIPAQYAEERFALGREDCSFLRVMDIVCPVCKGQRGIVYAPVGSGRTKFFSELAHSFLHLYPQAELIMVMLDLRPEELSEALELKGAAIVASSFEGMPSKTVRAAQLALERAKRIAENGGDAVILIDSISALTRAFAYSMPPSGITTAGGLDFAAINEAKKYFSAARKLKDAGSVTILASALKGRGVSMDQDVCEGLGAVANMFVYFDRDIAVRGIIPAVNFSRSYTKRAECFQTEEEQNCARALRRIADGEFGAEHLRELIAKTKTNEEFLARRELWSGEEKE